MISKCLKSLLLGLPAIHSLGWNPTRSPGLPHSPLKALFSLCITFTCTCPPTHPHTHTPQLFPPIILNGMTAQTFFSDLFFYGMSVDSAFTFFPTLELHRVESSLPVVTLEGSHMTGSDNRIDLGNRQAYCTFKLM